MEIKLTSIEMDTSIQCRSTIDTALVNEYAERMTEGDKFPPVDLYGDKGRCWIGDGWHRIMAAQQTGVDSIPATLHPGGRVEALKHALGANALHGHRRNNADKRRCVEIALREFPKLSCRAIAEMCGVHHDLAYDMRKQVSESDNCQTRTGRDGKTYPGRRKDRQSSGKALKDRDEAEPETRKEQRKMGPPCDGMQFARMAVLDLEQIRNDDIERQQAFDHVKGWIKDNEG